MNALQPSIALSELKPLKMRGELKPLPSINALPGHRYIQL